MKAKNYSSVEEFALDPKFRKYVLKPEEKDLDYWDAFLKNNPEKIIFIREAKELVVWLDQSRTTSNQNYISGKDADSLWEKIKNKSSVTPLHQNSIPKDTEPRKKIPFLRFGIAATLALLVSYGAFWYSNSLNEFSNEKVSEPEWISNYNSPGIKSSIRLSDGSKVILNSGSQIRYKSHFDNAKREIYLEGEAFFEVAKDSLRPFIVYTGNFTTQALGTSFNIKSFKGRTTQVTLATGIIEVSDLTINEKKTLYPGDGVEFHDSIGEIKKVNVDKALSWTEKTLTFEQLEFQTVIEELSNWYGVHITLQNTPKVLPSTTASYQDESLENILLGLSYKLDFTYEIKEKEVSINFIKK